MRNAAKLQLVKVSQELDATYNGYIKLARSYGFL